MRLPATAGIEFNFEDNQVGPPLIMQLQRRPESEFATKPLLCDVCS